MYNYVHIEITLAVNEGRLGSAGRRLPAQSPPARWYWTWSPNHSDVTNRCSFGSGSQPRYLEKKTVKKYGLVSKKPQKNLLMINWKAIVDKLINQAMKQNEALGARILSTSPHQTWELETASDGSPIWLPLVFTEGMSVYLVYWCYYHVDIREFVIILMRPTTCCIIRSNEIKDAELTRQTYSFGY